MGNKLEQEYSICVIHDKDGFEKFNKEKFNKYEERLRREIRRMVYDRFVLIAGDIFSIYEDEEDEYGCEVGDSIYYKIVSRTVYYNHGIINIIYRIDDE